MFDDTEDHFPANHHEDPDGIVTTAQLLSLSPSHSFVIAIMKVGLPQLSWWLVVFLLLFSLKNDYEYYTLAWNHHQHQRPSPLPRQRRRPLTTRSAEDAVGRLSCLVVDRRTCMRNAARLASLVVVLDQQPARAGVAPTTAGEAVRQTAANLPGYGPTDVFFPASWAGLWRVQRQVSLGGNTVESSSSAAIQLDYTIRFVPASMQDAAVVADRGYNQAHLEAAAAGSNTGNTLLLPSPQWTVTNPNDLRLAWPDGRTKDVKVTQRAADYRQVAEGRLWSSEVQRVTTDGGGSSMNAVPEITARRVVTQYRWEPTTTDAPTLVQALEVIYDLGRTDPLQAASNKNKNAILSKSRIVMQKLDVNQQ